MDEVRAFIAERNLLGPPFDEVLDDLSASIARDLASPLPHTEADRGVDFRDERTIKAWGEWEQEKWEKLEVTSEQVEEMKRTRARLLADREEEPLLEREFTMPWWPEDSEVIFSRQAQRAARPVSPFTPADTMAQMKELLDASGPMEEPEDDEEMRQANEMPDINVALDLQLEATPEQIAFVKAYAASVKLAGQTSALQSLHEEDRVDLSTLALPEPYRAPSPPLFARPPRKRSPALVDLAKFVKEEGGTGPLQIPSSPTGRGINMREWNKEEHILNLPSSSTLPPSEGPIWSSPPPPIVLDRSARELEDYKLEPPLFPRASKKTDRAENEISLTPLEALGLLPRRLGQLDDSAEEEEIDELADDDALQIGLDFSAASLASKLGSDTTLGSDDHPHSLLIDAYIKPPKLPLPRPTSPPSPPLPSSFNPTSGSSWALKPIAEPGALSLELETKFHNVKLGSIEELIDEEEMANVEELRAQARVLRDGLTKPREGEESLVERSDSVLVALTMEEESGDELLVARTSMGDASTEPAEQRIEEAAESLKKEPSASQSRSNTIPAISPAANKDPAVLSPEAEAAGPVQYRTPPPRWSPPPHRGQLSAPSKLETAISRSTVFPPPESSPEEPASDFIYPESFMSFIGDRSADGSEDGTEMEELEPERVDETSSTLNAVKDDSFEVQESLMVGENGGQQDPTSIVVASVEAPNDGIAFQPADQHPSTSKVVERSLRPSVLSTIASQDSQAPELGWSSGDALSRFLSTRGQARKVEGKEQAPRHSTPPVVASSEHNPPPSHHSSPPPDSIPFSVPPFLTSPVADTNSSAPHRVVAFPRLLRKRSHLQALRSANIEIVDRPSRLSVEPHLILDGSTCVIFHALNKLVGAAYRQHELDTDELPTARDPAVFTTLHWLSQRFDRILLLLEESEITPPPDTPTRMRPYAYTPPVLTALRQLADGIEQHGRDGIAVEVVLSKSPTHSATITRQLLEHLKRDMSGVDVGMWDERDWLRDDPTEDENALLQLLDLNELTAMWILYRCDLETFLSLGAEERERAFGQVIASDRLNRISTAIDINRGDAQVEGAPSSPRSFAELEATADDALPQVDMLDEAFNWAAYDQA